MDDLTANIATVIVGIVALCITGWTMIAVRLYQRQPPLAFDPRREAPWGLWDLLLVLALAFGPSLAVGVYFQPLLGSANPSSEALKELLRWNSFVSVISIFGMITYFQFRPQASLQDVGLNLRGLGHQFGVGIACFMLVAPVVFAIQAMFVLLLKFESKHPLIELLQDDPSAFYVCAFLAVVVAPISEELVFRGFLQGWLERLPLFRADMDSFLLGRRQTSEEDDLLYCETNRDTRRVALMPIIISSTVFALMHFSHGPDPIPLFFLALALGFVYQRTHRLLPCIIVHACLNGTTMLLLWLSLDELGK
ncbi:MAG TPA: CPBP family intramembrane metalloprotease [Pirellulaceae bacterium]|nr:CPBP family intramembrane metalloprotease [Planctomycetales bacterium]MCB9939329.1 CPBP family intramembrane metalloprotease [Planctomycetaceae bacterium]HRX79050.1 CPBP family intramembrane metalloprotease [Pirellulaceae bacterium]